MKLSPDTLPCTGRMSQLPTVQIPFSKINYESDGLGESGAYSALPAQHRTQSAEVARAATRQLGSR